MCKYEVTEYQQCLIDAESLGEAIEKAAEDEFWLNADSNVWTEVREYNDTVPGNPNGKIVRGIKLSDMTVDEMITLLSKFPRDAKFYITGCNEGYLYVGENEAFITVDTDDLSDEYVDALKQES